MRASLRSGWIRRLCVVVVVGAAMESRSDAENLPIVVDVEFQPLVAQVKRVVDALEMLGQPLDRDEKARLTAALDSTGGESSIRAIQSVLDARTPDGDRNQSGEPGQVVARSGAAAVDSERLVRFSRQG